MEKNRESFSMLFFSIVCNFSGEHFNSSKKFHGKLKAYEIFSCVKFVCEKMKGIVFLLSMIGAQ